MNPHLKYSFPGDGIAFHLASPDLHPKYHYKTFVGGILILTCEDFALVNGMSNKYWGWGLEDDEFYVRLKEHNIRVVRPQGIKTGINDTFRHVHRSDHKRDQVKLFNQREVTRRRDRKTGLDNVQYRLIAKRNLTINSAPFLLYDVELVCDVLKTPWCVPKSKANDTQQLLMKVDL
jgi:xylosylprotein 4-beta-galactosyltransferase